MNKNKKIFNQKKININKDIEKIIIKKGNKNIIKNDIILINYVASLIDSTGEDIFYNTYNKKPYVTNVGLEKGLDILNIALLNMKVNEISEFYFYNLNYLNNLKKFEFEKNTKFKFKIEVIKLIKRNSNKIKFKFVKII